MPSLFDELVKAIVQLERLAKVLNELDDKRAAQIKALEQRMNELEDYARETREATPERFA